MAEPSRAAKSIDKHHFIALFFIQISPFLHEFRMRLQDGLQDPDCRRTIIVEFVKLS